MRFPHVCDLFGIFRDDEYTYVATSCSTKLSQERETLDAERPQNLKSWGWRLKAIYFIGWSIYVFPLVLTVNEPWRFENSKVTDGIWWNLDLEQRDWGVIRPMMRQLSFGMRCVSFPWFWVLPTTFADTNQKGSLSWRKPWPSLDYCRIVSICFHSAFHLRYDHLNGTIKHPCTSWKDLLSISLDSAVQWWDV